jgi:hypothetical protein
LLTTLGFGADTVTLVERLRCIGCPKEPFVIAKAVRATGTQPVYERVANDESSEEFEWAGIEQKFRARPIESESQKGWAFFELDSVDPKKGGAPRVSGRIVVTTIALSVIVPRRVSAVVQSLSLMPSFCARRGWISMRG